MILSIAAIISGCSTIPVYDAEVCSDLGSYGAECAHTLIDSKRFITKPQWDKERVGMLCMDSQGFTDTETAIDQFCTAYNVCDYQTRAALQAAFFRIQPVIDRAKTAKGK